MIGQGSPIWLAGVIKEIWKSLVRHGRLWGIPNEVDF